MVWVCFGFWDCGVGWGARGLGSAVSPVGEVRLEKRPDLMLGGWFRLINFEPVGRYVSG